MDTGTSYYIVTPDKDVYVEELDPSRGDGPSRVRIKGTTFTYWSRFRESTYRFSEMIDDDEFRTLMRSTIEEARKTSVWSESKVPLVMLDRKGREVGTTAYVGSDVLPRVRLPLRGQVTPAAAAAGPGDLGDLSYLEEVRSCMKPISPAPEGYVWLSEESTALGGVAEEVDVVRGGGIAVSDELGLVLTRGVWVKARLKRLEDVPSYSEELRRRYREAAAPALEELRVGPAKEETKEEEEETAKDPEDVRILAVDYDAQGLRHKEMKDGVREISEHPFQDWPHEGPLTTVHLVKHMWRNGGGAKGWLNEWARFKEVGEQDRVMFELRTLVESIHYAIVYDQINVGALASFETISRRIQAIVDAYSAGSKGNPDWGSAKYITNYRGPEDAVSPQLLSWASKRGKEQADLATARSKIREGRRGLYADEAQAVADGGLPSSKPAARPKKKPGRGVAAPAQDS